jgi:hypothetical protein
MQPSAFSGGLVRQKESRPQIAGGFADALRGF